MFVFKNIDSCQKEPGYENFMDATSFTRNGRLSQILGQVSRLKLKRT